VDVQMHDRRGRNHRAYLWQYSRPGGSVVFDFQLGRGRDGPKKFLAGFNGILPTDGYAAYNKVGGEKLVHAGCWSHSRRKFYEAQQVCPGESAAKGIVGVIDDLFAIDAEARAQNLDLAARDRLRQQQARPLLETIRRQIEAAREQALRPASWAARLPTRWGCGSGSPGSWTTRSWS
jgi:transposase